MLMVMSYWGGEEEVIGQWSAVIGEEGMNIEHRREEECWILNFK
jgi:hypothetical protein